MTYSEDDFLALSGLQHLVFCERQWAFIHVEQTWIENRLTAEGRLLHKKADSDRIEARKGVRVVRGMRIFSTRMGLSGRADIVEFREKDDPGGEDPITPVEYKRGRPKPHDADRVQLCAQALCLEEMFDAQVPRGWLFYGKNRRRTEVLCDKELRDTTRRLATRMHELFESGVTPTGRNDTMCGNCSFVDLCMPEVSCGSGERNYLMTMIDSHLQAP